MEAMYTEKDEKEALSTLGSRHRISIPPSMVLRPHDPLVHWTARAHYMDFLCLIGGDGGLDVVLPPEEFRDGFELELSFANLSRCFPGKFAALGFPCRGRLVWLGKSHGDDVWGSMVPRSFVLGSSEVGDDDQRGSSVIPTSRLNRLVVMLVWLLAKKTSTRFHWRDGNAPLDSTKPIPWDDLVDDAFE